MDPNSETKKMTSNPSETQKLAPPRGPGNITHSNIYSSDKITCIFFYVNTSLSHRSAIVLLGIYMLLILNV